jgi:hypothetical protein
VETNLGGNYFFGWNDFVVEKFEVWIAKKGTTSNLKDLQIQCSKGTSIFTSWLCLCLADFHFSTFQPWLYVGQWTCDAWLLDECACKKLLMDSLEASGRWFLESKWLIFKSKWPWIKKIIFWYGVWDSPQICKTNLPIEIKSQKSKLSLQFAFTFVMRMSWLAMAQLCSVMQSSDNGLDCLGQWLASNNGLVHVNRW